MSRLLASCSLVSLIVASGLAAAADSVAEVQGWLDRMSRAVRDLNYEGTFVYHHERDLQVMRIVHKAGPEGEQERLVSLNGAAREVIRDERSVTCILPDSRSVVVDKSRGERSFPASFPERFAEIADYYKFTLDKQERVAGRSAQLILIKPIDGYRYGYRLGVDTDTGLLLKSDQIDENGVPVEQFVFTEIKVHDDIDEALLKPANSGKEYTWHRRERGESAVRLGADSKWQVDQVPPGFAMAHQSRHWLPAGDAPVTHKVFTDGLAWVSVYIEAASHAKEVLEGDSHMGAVNAFGRIVGDHQVTVVGEVPKATVRMIGKSVRLAGGVQGQ